jgi:hypothetical protein
MDDDMSWVYDFGPLELETTDSGVPPVFYSMAANESGTAMAQHIVTRPPRLPMVGMRLLNARYVRSQPEIGSSSRQLFPKESGARGTSGCNNSTTFNMTP